MFPQALCTTETELNSIIEIELSVYSLLIVNLISGVFMYLPCLMPSCILLLLLVRSPIYSYDLLLVKITTSTNLQPVFPCPMFSHEALDGPSFPCSSDNLSLAVP